MKKCNKCKENKDLSNFYAHPKIKFRPYCKACCKVLNRQYYINNREKVINTNRIWQKENWEYRKTYISGYTADRSSIDLTFKLSKYIRSRLVKVIKDKPSNSSFIRDLGCSVEHLIEHLELQFKPGMNWNNYGSEWHIDHIIPLSRLDLSKREDFVVGAHFKNLQPLWKHENLKKGNNIWL